MSMYRVTFDGGATVSITVEAENEEAAIEAAYDEIPTTVCAQCSGWGQSWGLDLGEWEPSKFESVVALDGDEQ